MGISRCAPSFPPHSRGSACASRCTASATDSVDADDQRSDSDQSIRAISDGTTRFFLDDPDGNTFAGTYVEVTSTDPNAPQTGNYVVFRGLTSDRVTLRVASYDGDRMLSATSDTYLDLAATDAIEQAHQLGEDVADHLLAQGAHDLIRQAELAAVQNQLISN